LDEKGEGFAEYCITQGVGYINNAGDFLAYLVKAGYNNADIWLYKFEDDNLTNTIAYPIYDKYGFISYFNFRGFGDNKYNSGSESIPTYQKNLMGGLKSIKSNDYIFAVEGENDRLALKKHGYPAVSMQGTKLNKEMIDLLSIYDILNVYLWVDGDQGGWSLIEKVFKDYAELFCKSNINGYTIFIEGQDPDKAALSGINIEALMKEALLIPAHYLKKMTVEHSLVTGAIPELIKYNALTYEYMIDFLYMITGYNPESIRDMVYERKKPDTEIEKRVLSALDLDLIATHSLTEDLFFLRASKIIFKYIAAGSLGDVGSKPPDWAIEFYRNLPVSVDIEDDIKELRAIAQNNKIQNLAKKVLNSRDDIEEKLNLISRGVTEIYDNQERKDSSFGGILKNRIDDLMSGNIDKGFSFGENWKQLSYILAGLRKKLYMLSGNAKHGKTTLVLNWIAHWCESNIPGLFISEMPEEEVVDKLISIMTDIKGRSLMVGNLDSEDIRKLFLITQCVNPKSLFIEREFNFGQILSLISYYKIRHKIKYVAIDYIQLLSPATYMKGMAKYEYLIEMVTRLKNDICGKLDLPVIVLSQLNDAELDATLPSARGASGSKGMIAAVDLHMAMRQKSKKDMDLDSGNGNALLHIDRSRYTAGGVIDLDFNGEISAMKEVSKNY
jgi:replicative DNA helicase